METAYQGVLSRVSRPHNLSLIKPSQNSSASSSILALPVGRNANLHSAQICNIATAHLVKGTTSSSYRSSKRNNAQGCLPHKSTKGFLAKPQAGFYSRTSQLLYQRAGLKRVAAAAELQSVKLEEAETADPFPFHLDTAVLLAGFAFEAYNDETEGIQEISTCGTESIFLNEDFVKELYQGQLKITLGSASGLPGTSLTGTSDPYVVFTVGDSMVRSETMWRDLAPTWDADFSIFVVDPRQQALTVQVFDENVVGNDVLLASGSVDLNGLTDGSQRNLNLDLHLDLEKKEEDDDRKGGSEAAGPKLRLTARYEGFTGQTVLNRTLKNKKEESDEKTGARGFVETVSQKLMSGKDGGLEGKSTGLDAKRTGFSTDLWGSHSKNETEEDVEDLNDSESEDEDDDVAVTSAGGKRRPEEAWLRFGKRTGPDARRKGSGEWGTDSVRNAAGSDAGRNGSGRIPGKGVRKAEKKRALDGFSTDLWGTHSESEKDETVEDLNDSEDDDVTDDEDDVVVTSADARRGAKAAKVMEGARESLLEGLSRAAQAEGSLKVPGKGKGVKRPGLLKALSAFATCPCPCCLAELLADSPTAQPDFPGAENGNGPRHVLDVPWGERSGALWNPPKAQKEILVEKELEREQEKVAKVFADAESAVEAWAILADSLGKPGYVKSEFEKVVFVDHEGSDTQASVWRDPARKRIVVAFRGTEQTEWKDLVTDVNLTPAKFEIDGQEVQGEADEGEIILHGGFKNAYDSVRSRLRSIVRRISREPGSMNSRSRNVDTQKSYSSSQAGAASDGVNGPVSPGRSARGNGDKWSLLVTGHSLGGALATLFAAEMAVVATRGDCTLDHVAMYNFGSPRVGNHAFAAYYNSHVPDTWRLANRDDVITTIPRMMGYRHVGNALILGDKPGSPVESAETVSGDPDGTDSDDLLGEVSAKDFLPKLLKGEQTLLKKVVEKELAILDALTDGSALLQHMEDFYYKALLQMVELHIGRGVDTPQVANA